MKKDFLLACLEPNAHCFHWVTLSSSIKGEGGKSFSHNVTNLSYLSIFFRVGGCLFVSQNRLFKVFFLSLHHTHTLQHFAPGVCFPQGPVISVAGGSP